jgi:hypothetical protein
MTKVRPPLTIPNAITRVAGLIGWDAAAGAVDMIERTVRNWSDPDTPAEIPVWAAIRLDAAYIAAGGDGAPILQCYENLLDIAQAHACADSDALAEQTAVAAKESGDAVAALVRASRRGASRTDRAIAARETEEAIAALKNTLPNLAAGAGEDMDRSEGGK